MFAIGVTVMAKDFQNSNHKHPEAGCKRVNRKLGRMRSRVSLNSVFIFK